MKHKRVYRGTLTDETTVSGRLVWSWGWWAYRLVEVTVQPVAVSEPVKVAGALIVPRRSIHLVQEVPA
jgi:hypothetical protein